MRIAAIIIAAIVTGSSANASIVVNGSFEDGITPGGVTSLATGDTTSLPGWTVLKEGVDYVGTNWLASDGSRSIELSSATSGGISQKLTGLIAGQHYQMTFDVSADPTGGDFEKGVVASITGGGARFFDYVRTAANSPTNMLYQTFTYDFYAGNTYALLSFRGRDYNAFGAVLDNVSISAIPEPATWALMVGGLAMTGFSLRRRKSSVLA